VCGALQCLPECVPDQSSARADVARLLGPRGRGRGKARVTSAGATLCVMIPGRFASSGERNRRGCHWPGTPRPRGSFALDAWKAAYCTRRLGDDTSSIAQAEGFVAFAKYTSDSRRMRQRDEWVYGSRLGRR
jgi:hypothetical protein